jgi:hypothetical protein
MKKEVAIKLKKKADEIAENYSRPNREFNVGNEIFEVQKIEPLSESTAIVLLKKSSNKYAVAFCYLINMNGGTWRYFIPTYDHCIGMESVKPLLAAVEKTNFSENF